MRGTLYVIIANAKGMKNIKNKFFEWIEDNRTIFLEHNFTYEVKRSEGTLDDATSLHLDNNKFIGHITIWNSGQMESEFIEVHTEKRVCWKYKENAIGLDLDELISEVFSEIDE